MRCELPIIGVNTYLNPNPPTEEERNEIQLARATTWEKEEQIKQLQMFKKKHENYSENALQKLKYTVVNGDNIFAELMNCVNVASLGQITQALYEVGGKYRRNM